MEKILHWLLSSALLYGTGQIIAGIEIKSYWTSMLAVFLIGFLNIILRPLLLILTLPINILTIGLFTFVINACILKVTAGFMKNFTISGWGPAIKAAVVLAILNCLFNLFFKIERDDT